MSISLIYAQIDSMENRRDQGIEYAARSHR